MTHAEEARLVEQAARGDRMALRTLAREHLERMHAHAYRMLGNTADAEDVAQEAFVRLWQALPDWQTGRAKISTWLYRVVTNLAIDRARRRREVALPEDYDAPDPGKQPEETLMQAEFSADVRSALDKLPERQKAAILLCHFEEMGNAEAASVLGVSVEAIESLLSRGRRALRLHLEQLAPQIGAGNGA